MTERETERGFGPSGSLGKAGVDAIATMGLLLDDTPRVTRSGWARRATPGQVAGFGKTG